MCLPCGKDMMAHSKILSFLPIVLLPMDAPLEFLSLLRWETSYYSCRSLQHQTVSISFPATNTSGLPLPLSHGLAVQEGTRGWEREEAKHHFTKAGLSVGPKCIIFK